MLYSYIYDTSIGTLTVTANEKAVTNLDFGEAIRGDIIETEIIKSAYLQLSEYLHGIRKRFSLSLEPDGTEFQKSVWDAVSKIPYGRTRTYAQIAKFSGNGAAYRAVGAACGKNPIPIFIPCHRVGGSRGELTGYNGGLDIKRALLDLERRNIRYFEYGKTELDYLKARDAALGVAIDKIGFVEYEVIPDLFEALVYNIVGQQISMKAVDTIWHRMQSLYGKVTPQRIHGMTAQEIQSVGITMRKAEYIKDLAEKVWGGEFDIESVKNLPDSEVIATLSSLKGVGEWTAEMLMIFSLERKNILSWNDLGIRRGICRLYGLETLDKTEFEKYRSRYSPYETIASFYLWALGNPNTNLSLKPV